MNRWRNNRSKPVHLETHQIRRITSSKLRRLNKKIYLHLFWEEMIAPSPDHCIFQLVVTFFSREMETMGLN